MEQPHLLFHRIHYHLAFPRKGRTQNLPRVSQSAKSPRTYLGHCCAAAKMFHQEGLFCLASPGEPGSTTPFRLFLSNLMACQDFLLTFLSAMFTASSSMLGHDDSWWQGMSPASSIQGSFSWTTCNTSWLIMAPRNYMAPGTGHSGTRRWLV